ncbi:MAG: cadmium-translocating P-type ATPase [Eubacterium sp.]|nr:cadmium-translocating P-type ATPase [Eubacterium sp.]
MTRKQKKVFYRIVISIVLLIGVVITSRMATIPEYAKAILFLIPYFVIGYDILKKALLGIKNGQIFDENFLMAIATVGAFALGEFLEAASVMLFYQIGELFQSIAVGKSRKNISSLMDIRPDFANVERNGEIVSLEPDEVEIGTEIIVNPGEKIPIDGVITQGKTELNTSALTGESMPCEAEVGDEVISGSINMTALIKVRTTKEFGESTVSKILDLVENSSMKKSRSENFITRFAKYYTPAVCAGALVLALVPPLVRLISGSEAMWQEWIIRALTFLVISCPCALVISIPLSFFGGIGCASSNGILVKGSNYLEALSKTTCVVFDKTGTLTKGVFEVSEIKPAGAFSRNELIEYTAYAELASSHPISISIKNAYNKSLDRSRVGEIEEISGHGVKAVVDGKVVYVGNEKLMKSIGVDVNENGEITTTVYTSIDGEYAGYISIADTLKPTSKNALKALKANGVRKTVMLTGDNETTAKAVAEALELDEYKASLLPADKVSEVERLLSEKSDKECLAFVGDGINDAPVLSRADVGIAMGALGSDAAIEAADIVLMDDNPQKISLAKKISAKTLKIVKENIVFSLAVKFICLILGALGIANMWVAIFADVGVMVIAVINATRALRIKL